jgi:hypothetical protein
VLIFDSIFLNENYNLLLMESKEEQIVVNPSSQLDFTEWSTADGRWIFRHSQYGMSSSKELDKLQDLAECELPDVFYGKNLFLCAMPSRNLLIELSPIHSIALSGFARRAKYMRVNREPVSVQSSSHDEIHKLN